jgi:Cobalamin-independent synthase, Catalytic domain
MGSALPLLPTTVIGSYSVPDWLERLKTDYHRGQLSGTQLESVHEVAIKAAIKDQEIAGIDIVTDGELRRDNDIDYILSRLPGVQVDRPTKSFYYDYYDAEVVSALPVDEPATVGLADDFEFARRQTDRLLKVSFTGPFSLSRRLRDRHYGSQRELVLALARVLRGEAAGLAAAGATVIQIDEPFLAGYPDDVDLAIEAVNVVTKDVDVEWGLHVCYGNPLRAPLLGGPLRLPLPGSAGRERRPAAAGVRPQGLPGPRGRRPRRLGPQARCRRRRREEPAGGAAGADRVPDPPGRRRARRAEPDRQPRLRPAAPAGRRRQGQARRDGRGQRGGAGGAAARRPGSA